MENGKQGAGKNWKKEECCGKNYGCTGIRENWEFELMQRVVELYK